MERVRLRFVLALVILGVVAAAIFQRQVAGSGGDARELPELPNVLIVVVDRLRYDATALADPVAFPCPRSRTVEEALVQLLNVPLSNVLLDRIRVL